MRDFKENNQLLFKHNSNMGSMLKQKIEEAREKIKILSRLSKSPLDKEINFEYFYEEEIDEEQLKEKLSKAELTIERLIKNQCYNVDSEGYLGLTREELVYKMQQEWIAFRQSFLGNEEAHNQEERLKQISKEIVSLNSRLENIKLSLDKQFLESTGEIFFQENQYTNLDYFTNIQEFQYFISNLLKLIAQDKSAFNQINTINKMIQYPFLSIQYYENYREDVGNGLSKQEAIEKAAYGITLEHMKKMGGSKKHLQKKPFKQRVVEAVLKKPYLKDYIEEHKEELGEYATNYLQRVENRQMKMKEL